MRDRVGWGEIVCVPVMSGFFVYVMVLYWCLCVCVGVLDAV